MNILLWVLQVLLAFHTAMGAMWKFSNSEQSAPSLYMIPLGVWLAMSVVAALTIPVLAAFEAEPAAADEPT